MRRTHGRDDSPVLKERVNSLRPQSHWLKAYDHRKVLGETWNFSAVATLRLTIPEVAGILLPTQTVVAGDRVFGGVVCLSVRLSVCLFFRTISQKPLQLGSPNLDTEIFHHESRKPLLMTSKVKGQGHEAQKTVPAWIFALLCQLLLLCKVLRTFFGEKLKGSSKRNRRASSRDTYPLLSRS